VLGFGVYFFDPITTRVAPLDIGVCPVFFGVTIFWATIGMVVWALV
jgi:hypothetical protein